MLEEPGWSIRLRFNGELSAQSPRRTVQRLFSYLVLERLPTPGLALSGWEGRPLTPSSHSSRDANGREQPGEAKGYNTMGSPSLSLPIGLGTPLPRRR